MVRVGTVAALLACACGGTTLGGGPDLAGEGEEEPEGTESPDPDGQAGGDDGADPAGEGEGDPAPPLPADGEGEGEADPTPAPGEGEGERDVDPPPTPAGEGEGEPPPPPPPPGAGEGEGEGEPPPPEFLPDSCRVIGAMGIDPDDGPVTIDPDGPGPIEPFEVLCDMETDGGGWTLLDPCDVRNHLGAELEWSTRAPVETFDDQCRLGTQDAEGDHGYTWTFRFPPGFTQFFLADYAIRAFGLGDHTSELDSGQFVQRFWNIPQSDFHGDVSFGAALHRGPVTTFATELQGERRECTSCEIEWPAGRRVYTLGDERLTEFRISWGEAGPQAEGWYPWWRGFIALR